MESLMYDRQISCMLKHNIFFLISVWGSEGKSTHMSIITLVDRITGALDNGDHVVGVFLDFSKAFDTVDQSFLLDKILFMASNLQLYNDLKIIWLGDLNI